MTASTKHLVLGSFLAVAMSACVAEVDEGSELLGADESEVGCKLGLKCPKTQTNGCAGAETVDACISAKLEQGNEFNFQDVCAYRERSAGRPGVLFSLVQPNGWLPSTSFGKYAGEGFHTIDEACGGGAYQTFTPGPEVCPSVRDPNGNPGYWRNDGFCASTADGEYGGPGLAHE